MHIWSQPILVSHSVPIIPQVISGAQWTCPGRKSSISPVSGATHLEPLSDALGDADGELCYLGRTHFAFLAVRFIFSLSFRPPCSGNRSKQLGVWPHAFQHTCPRGQVVREDSSVQVTILPGISQRMSTVTTVQLSSVPRLVRNYALIIPEAAPRREI